MYKYSCVHQQCAYGATISGVGGKGRTYRERNGLSCKDCSTREIVSTLFSLHIYIYIYIFVSHTSKACGFISSKELSLKSFEVCTEKPFFCVLGLIICESIFSLELML